MSLGTMQYYNGCMSKKRKESYDVYTYFELVGCDKKSLKAHHCLAWWMNESDRTALFEFLLFSIWLSGQCRARRKLHVTLEGKVLIDCFVEMFYFLFYLKFCCSPQDLQEGNDVSRVQ